LPRRLWPIVQSQAECATRIWKQPDQGIWEARGDPKQYVSSKLMCWVALDRAARLAEIRGDDDLIRKWRATAEEIRTDILAHGVSDAGCYVQHYETDALDASHCCHHFGFVPPTDELARKTVDAIANDLTEDGFVLRYRTDETDDGMSGKEGSFLICSFWLVSALASVGEVARARELMENCSRRISARSLRRRVRTRDGAAPRQLPAGVLPSGPHRGGGQDHHVGAAQGVWMNGQYDVIIIGTGAGGGTLHTRSRSSGKRILLLERGDWLPASRKTGRRAESS
jgi:hypothetical protein